MNNIYQFEKAKLDNSLVKHNFFRGKFLNRAKNQEARIKMKRLKNIRHKTF